MRFDALVAADATQGIDQVIGFARQAQDAGFGALWLPETKHDPFLPLAVAAEHTDRIALGTSIAVALARSPMTVAQTAWDLQRYSKGRFVLGLGSQVKAHVLHRFSMPWTNHPAGQMRDYLGALRAIWSAWQDRTPLRYYSRHYHHTLMTPFFDPGPLPWGPPKLYLAAVGPQMTRLAGELADGVILHAFTTPRYVTEVTKPALATARRIDVHLLALIITGETDADLARARDAVRSQIAFYGSTPTYRGVLELHGWAELADRLSQALAAGPQAFATLGDLVPDEVVDAFAVTARPCDLAAALHQRWSGLVDSLAYYAPYPTPPGLWDPVARELARLAAAADLRRT